jgi:hypothetical protein
MKRVAVEPVPRPTTIPASMKSRLFLAANSFASSVNSMVTYYPGIPALLSKRAAESFSGALGGRNFIFSTP